MFKKVDKVLAALGNMKAMERLHVDTFTENKIHTIEEEKIGASENGELFINFQELNGYLFLNVIILSKINIKTYKGGTLTFSGTENNFVLQSDTQEIESEYSNVSFRYITEISFCIDQKEIEFIRNRDFEKIQFNFKKKSLLFDKIQS